MNEAHAKDWDLAARCDDRLAPWREVEAELDRRELRPERYSRKRFFERVARGEPVLFGDHPLRRSLGSFFAGSAAQALRSLFSPRRTTLVKSGPSQRRRFLPVHRAIHIWERDRATLSAYDIYYRDLKLDRAFDCDAIADFSVLRDGPPDIRDLEVATLLIGTSGAQTFAHSDDPDGCNHAVLGKKFWIVWDRFEGSEAGLEDCAHDEVVTTPRFDLASFASLPSSRWFMMTSGRTLFLPGNYTHRVITLARYLGISSFYVGLANGLSSLSRWRLHHTDMVTDHSSDGVVELLLRRLRKTARGDRAEKRRWGFDQIGLALAAWRRGHDRPQREAMLSERRFREFVEEMQALC